MHLLDVARLIRTGGVALLLTLPALCSGEPAAAPVAAPVTPGLEHARSSPGDTGAGGSIVPDLGRYFGTWLWIKSEGLVAESDPETKGAARTLVLEPDMTYEFHERHDTRDTVLCRGGYLFSEQSQKGGDVLEAFEFEGWFEPYERRMVADFDGPDTLHLAGYACDNCPDHAFVRGRTASFGGFVTRGKRFARDLWDGLRLELDPIPLGWEVAIRDTARPSENLARLTPPLHSVPNPRLIEGWHFRNKANTGPNQGDVNAPQQRRDFIFSREVGKTIQGAGPDHGVTEEEVERVANEGRGVLTIQEMKLVAAVPGGKAGIESMRFVVAVEEVQGRSRRAAGSPTKKAAGP